mmetsp:Transcript_21946/g.35304  ORF Transcript_21946/g.35304 Transcript_21946/m.35304 type:complete len:382 (+) Transcript_21946:25-1170(+)
MSNEGIFLFRIFATLPLILAIWLATLSHNCHGWHHGVSGFSSCQQPQQRQQQSKVQSSLPSTTSFHNDDDVIHTSDETENTSVPSTWSFPSHRPLLAIITEPNACDSDASMERTFHAIQQAVSTQDVDLVSLRLEIRPSNSNIDERNQELEINVMERACTLAKRLVQLSEQQAQEQYTSGALPATTTSSFKVVCSSDFISVAMEAKVHGIHFKEHHYQNHTFVTQVVQSFDYPILLGTSTHSISSAVVESFRDSSSTSTLSSDKAPKPHYIFVGTCYPTASHPEKTIMEGPALPGQIRKKLISLLAAQQEQQDEEKEEGIMKAPLLPPPPPVFAIGGIEATNCHEPVSMGANGVAVIRAVLQAEDPAEMVNTLQTNMKQKG